MLCHLDWKENYHIVFEGTPLSNSCFTLRDLFAVLRTSRPGRFCTPNRIASRTPDGSELVPDRKPLCALHGFVVATPCGGGAQGVAFPILLRRMIIVFNLASKLRGYVAQPESTSCRSTNIFKYITRYLHIKKYLVTKQLGSSGVRVVKWWAKSALSRGWGWG